MKSRPFQVRVLHICVGMLLVGLTLAVARTLSPPEMESALLASLLTATLTLFLLDKRYLAFWVGVLTLAAALLWAMQVLELYRVTR